MRARFFCLLTVVVLIASGVARADYTEVSIDADQGAYTGVPLDAAKGSYYDNFQNTNTISTLAPGSFSDYNLPGDVLLTALLTRRTLTLTNYYVDDFELAIFSIGDRPAFGSLTLLSSDFSPSLEYAVGEGGVIEIKWIGNFGQGGPGPKMTAVFAYTPAANPVPEPSSLLLLGTGCLLGLSLMHRRQSQLSRTIPVEPV